MVIAILLLDATMLPSIGLGGKNLFFARFHMYRRSP